MDPNALKARIVLLWLFQAVNYTSLILLGFLDTGRIASTPGESTLGAAIAFFLCCLLSWLTVTLKPAVSRWTNTVVAIPFVLLKASAVTELYPLPSYSLAVLFNEAWGLVGAVAIIWYAWQKPKVVAP